MKMKRLLSAVLSLCMIVSLLASSVTVSFAQDTDSKTSTKELEIEQLTGNGKHWFSDSVSEKDTVEESIAPDQLVKVFILMQGNSVLESDRQAELNSRTQLQMAGIEACQNAVIRRIESSALKGAELDVAYQYTWLTNAVAATVPYGAIEAIEATPGVEKVLRQRTYSVCQNDIKTNSDGVMIGRENTWANGYTGEGMKIAIIDTGLDTDHQNFAALPADKLTTASATESMVAEKLSSLNAAARYEGLTVEDVYYSSKVAFGFNYVDYNLDITHDNDGQSDHGTHVAGIAAANKVDGSDVVGVAPDAQLYVMKVFGANGGAYDEDIMAALEDAMILGADVVNMSLGSTAGFTTDGEEMDALYNSVGESGVILSVAAGNEYTSAFMNSFGLDQSLTSNVDNATVGSPGTYANVMTVASVENLCVYDYFLTIGEQKISYSEGAYGKNAAVSTLVGQGYQVVAVPGLGAESDFEGLDVTGKIALIQRGELSFGEKVENAEAAGAVACLIYNNVSGGAPGVSLDGSSATIPMASISMGDGQRIIALLEDAPETLLYFSDEKASIPSPTAYEMSEFSSWGVAPDLTLEPDITAPGGNIYSTTTDGTYGLMSGTSMATPNVAGMAALVSQYAKELGYSGAKLHSFVYTLLMSTASPLSYDEESLYSPRSQGSGLANAFDAVTTRAFLTVPGCDVPKANLFDDPARTGSYSFTFQVNNFDSRDLFYDLRTTAQTEGVNTDYAELGYYFMSSTPMGLAAQTVESSDSLVLTHDVDNSGATGSHDAWWIYQAAVAGKPLDENWKEQSFRYDVDGNETANADDVQAYLDALVGNDSPADLEATVLRVAAGETAEVSVSISLDEADKAYFATYYPNGGYVEGFTLLTAKSSGSVDLSLPYLGFYGDWTDAPMLDSGYYWEDEETVEYSQYVHTIYGNYTYYGNAYMVPLGTNPYVEEAIDLSHVSLSPNEDGYGDYINEMYISLLRNVDKLNYNIANAETGEVYYDLTADHVSKSVYSSGNGGVVPSVYSWYDSTGYQLTDANGDTLANNTKLLLTITAQGIDYEGDEAETIRLPITVDTEAPTLLGAQLVTDEDTGKKLLTLTFKDNVSTAAVLLVDSMGLQTYGMYAVEDTEPKDGYQYYTQSYDVTELSGKLMLILGDYAFNESYYGINLGGEGTPYGDFVAFQNDGWGGYTWVSFDEDVNYDETTIFQSGVNFVCAEYINGYLFTETDDGKLYAIRYSDMLSNGYRLEATFLANLENVYQDLAYDYANGRLLGLCTSDYGSEIYEINLGEAYFDYDFWQEIPAFGEKYVYNYNSIYGLGMACDDEGTIYLMGGVYDWDIEGFTETAWLVESYTNTYGYTSFRNVGDTGVKMDYLQSMTWDHNTESLYWAQFYPTGSFLDASPSVLYKVNTETAELTRTGTLSNETYALVAPLADGITGHDNVPTFDVTEIGAPVLSQSNLTLTVGGLEQLICTFDPWYSEVTDVTWRSSDDMIATVDQNGVVTGVSAGSCEITVTSVADPTLSATCRVTVTALDMSITGFVAYSGGGVGTAGNSRYYTLNMVGGKSSLSIEDKLVVPAEFQGMGTSMSASVMGRGYLWAAEWGNTGIVYQIDPETNTVVDYIESLNGGHTYGLSYSESTDKFTAIMNYYLYTDLTMDEEMQQNMLDGYDPETYEWTYHSVNMAETLAYSDTGFATGEADQGSIVNVVFCGITDIDEPYTYAPEGMDAYRDFMGSMDGNRSGVNYAGINYTAATTHVLLDNVGRLWYVDEIPGFKTYQMEYEDYDWATGEPVTVTTTYYYNADDVYSGMEGDGMMFEASNLPNGMHFVEDTDADGNTTATCFFVRELEQTPLYDMFLAGTMPRYTYSFNALTYAGKDNDGGNMFAISLYDYWNNGNTSQLYLYLSGSSYFDYDLYEQVTVGRNLIALGNLGVGNMIATIHSVEITGGLPESTTAPTAIAARPLAAGAYRR